MSSLFKRSNGIYYICYDVDGKRRWKSTNQSRLADALHEMAQFEKLRKEYKPRDTLQSFSKDFLAHNQVSYSAKTLDMYRRSLNLLVRSVGNKLLPSVTPKEVDLYRSHRAIGHSPPTVNIELRCLRAAFSTAVRWKLIPENPFKGVPLLRVPDQLPTYFTKEEFQKIIGSIREQWFKDLVIVAVSEPLE